MCDVDTRLLRAADTCDYWYDVSMTFLVTRLETLAAYIKRWLDPSLSIDSRSPLLTKPPLPASQNSTPRFLRSQLAVGPFPRALSNALLPLDNLPTLSLVLARGGRAQSEPDDLCVRVWLTARQSGLVAGPDRLTCSLSRPRRGQVLAPPRRDLPWRGERGRASQEAYG